MRLNPDCVRDVLLYLESELVLNLKKHNFESLSLDQLNNHFSNIYTEEDIWYTVYNLNKIEYIEGQISGVQNMKMVFCDIENITWEGHQFLNTIRPVSIWDATKNGAKKLGVMSISALSMISSEIVKEIVTRKDVIDRILSTVKFD